MPAIEIYFFIEELGGGCKKGIKEIGSQKLGYMNRVCRFKNKSWKSWKGMYVISGWSGKLKT